jgi:CHAD domain-containing protein
LQPLNRHNAAPEADLEPSAAPSATPTPDVPPLPQKAAVPALDPQMTVSHAFKLIVASGLEHLQANEHGALVSADPEFVHQMRVAVRRLRSAFTVFGNALPKGAREPISAELKWLGNVLGPARDWDVFANETLPCVRRSYPEHSALAQLAEDASRQRAAARGAAQRALRSRKYQALVAALHTWLAQQAWRQNAGDDVLAALDGTVKRYAQTELETRYERVRKRGRRLETLDAAELHRLRIAVKKLRYSIDFFASLFDAQAVPRLRSRLSRLQDILGTINDAATLRMLVKKSFSDARAPGAMEAKGILLGWAAGRAHALQSELDRAWKPFRRSETYW